MPEGVDADVILRPGEYQKGQSDCRELGGGGWTYARSLNAEKVWENLRKVFGELRARPE
jgi:hypothetical protein